MYRTSDEFCDSCGSTKIVMHDRGEKPEETCHKCDLPMRVGFPAPLVMRAGFAEGQERGERWTMLKQSAKLEQEASLLRKNGKKEEAKEMKAEAKKLNQRAASKRDKTDK